MRSVIPAASKRSGDIVQVSGISVRPSVCVCVCDLIWLLIRSEVIGVNFHRLRDNSKNIGAMSQYLMQALLAQALVVFAVFC